MARTLNDLKPGERSVIVKISGQGPAKRRLMDMGVISGTDVVVRKVAPLGDPIEVNIRGYELTLRKADAEQVLVD